MIIKQHWLKNKENKQPKKNVKNKEKGLLCVTSTEFVKICKATNIHLKTLKITSIVHDIWFIIFCRYKNVFQK